MTGELSEARQGGAVLLVGGKPTVFGGFKNYDEYPTLVEQYDPDIGKFVDSLRIIFFHKIEFLFFS